MTFVRSLRPGFPKGLKVRFFFSPLHHRLIEREGTAPPAFKNQSLTIKYPFSHHQVVLVTEDETTFSESKEVLESLCYEGERIVSSHVVVTRAFTKRIFRLNFGYGAHAFWIFPLVSSSSSSSSRRFPVIKMSIFALENRKVPQKQGWSVHVSKAVRTSHIHTYAREGGRSLPQIRSDHFWIWTRRYSQWVTRTISPCNSLSLCASTRYNKLTHFFLLLFY